MPFITPNPRVCLDKHAGGVIRLQYRFPARAEAAGRGWSFIWSDSDPDGDHSYLEQPEFSGITVTSCESVVLCDEDGDVLAGLGCIDDADGDYRCEIENALAMEALAAL